MESIKKQNIAFEGVEDTLDSEGYYSLEDTIKAVCVSDYFPQRSTRLITVEGPLLPYDSVTNLNAHILSVDSGWATFGTDYSDFLLTICLTDSRYDIGEVSLTRPDGTMLTIVANLQSPETPVKKIVSVNPNNIYVLAEDAPEETIYNEDPATAYAFLNSIMPLSLYNKSSTPLIGLYKRFYENTPADYLITDTQTAHHSFIGKSGLGHNQVDNITSIQTQRSVSGYNDVVALEIETRHFIGKNAVAIYMRGVHDRVLDESRVIELSVGTRIDELEALFDPNFDPLGLLKTEGNPFVYVITSVISNLGYQTKI